MVRRVCLISKLGQTGVLNGVRCELTEQGAIRRGSCKRLDYITEHGNAENLLYIQPTLNKSLELNHSWQATSCAGTQKLPNTLLNPKVH
jgi:hypothetical protein